MTKTITTMTGIVAISLLSACSTTNQMPLIFGQAHSFGLNLSSTVADQGVDFNFGYKDKNMAIMPVMSCKESIHETADGQVLRVCEDKPDLVTSQEATSDPNSTGSQDAFSVLGQFEVNSKTAAETEGSPSITSEVGLGKFFATGLAAQKLADGFAAAMGKKAEQQ